jgi:monodictyphenone polyketide synthase
LSEATLAIREEIRDLPTELKSLIPAFHTIFDFADDVDLRRGPLSGSIEGVLLASVEIAVFLGCVSLQSTRTPTWVSVSLTVLPQSL